MHLKFIKITFFILFSSILQFCFLTKAQEKINSQVEEIIAGMTLDEKIGQLIQIAGVYEYREEFIRQGRIGSLLFGDDGPEEVNRIQRIAVEESRLGPWRKTRPTSPSSPIWPGTAPLWASPRVKGRPPWPGWGGRAAPVSGCSRPPSLKALIFIMEIKFRDAPELQQLLAEITRLAVRLGGRRETLAGLAGLGDLVLTCTGDLSRNRRVGMALAKGEALPQILADLGHVAEGVGAARAVRGLAAQHGVDMPICEAVDRALHEGLPVRDAVAELLRREPRPEVH